MKTSVEISYYPITNDYLGPIQSFIDRLNCYTSISVVTNGMSTQVFGEFKDVMTIITDEIEKSFDLPNSVFVLKIINAELNLYTPLNG